jgi:hypothetical protein
VLRIRDIYPGSKNFSFQILDPAQIFLKSRILHK